jgi:uncharacterized tellurite resistance protein B-like protein
MNRHDKVAYMANVLSIASVGGGIDDTEANVLRQIARKLEVNQDILDDAKTLLGGGSYRMQLPSLPADRMANLTDMVTVALADGEVKAREAAPIEKLAGVLGLAQADVDMMVARARNQLHRMREDKSPPKRSAPKQASKPAPPPLPGKPKPKPPPRPVQEAPPPRPRPKPARRAERPKPPKPAPRRAKARKPEPPPPPPPAIPEPPPAPERPAQPTASGWRAGPGVSIAFRGKGEALDACIEIALAAPNAGDHQSGGVAWHHATWPLAQLTDAVSLAEAALSLTDRKVYIDGKEKKWDDVFGFRACALGREKSEHPVEYCFGNEASGINPCGCRLLNFDWEKSAEWLTRGAFENDDLYRFDKAALGQMLESGLERVRHCPYLNPEQARAMLQALPDAIHAWGAWSHREASPGNMEVQAVNVTESLHGCAVMATKQVDGIAPTSARSAIRLIKAAARKCGSREPNYSLLYRSGRRGLRSP